MPDTDLIGERGEWITQLALTERVQGSQTLFRPQFLGDKYPTIDLIVELVGDNGEITPFFFAQVKSTTQGYLAGGPLRVSVSEEEMKRLIAYPIPTYVIGVDTIRPYRVYILAALPTGPDRLAAFPTTHELNTAALGALYDEVLHFWQAHPTPFIASRFV